MGLKSFISRLGGKSSTTGSERQGEPVSYQGFTIVPAPQAADGQFRIAGTITASGNNDSDSAEQTNPSPNTESTSARTHSFIRADLASNWEDACTMSVDKAKRIVDERGNSMFDD